ncbi:MAG TPA: hypothetical protein VK468_12105 [Pyrinomonadaceae bacterium]|jgi:hypothetical protein|nr:hypothetical protein [Pyrinomonadaceae bacterium]
MKASNVHRFFSNAIRYETNREAHNHFSHNDQPIPKPSEPLTAFEQILRDPSLARRMHTPDYFMLVE